MMYQLHSYSVKDSGENYRHVRTMSKSKTVQPTGETVWVGTASSSVDCYHSNQDCHKLHQCTNIKTIDKAFAEWRELSHCKRCSGEEQDNYITDSQCETIRSQLLTMQDTHLLASKHGIHQKVLCDHASGRCTCDAANPLEYSHSLREWVEK